MGGNAVKQHFFFWGGYHAMEVNQRWFQHCFWLELLMILTSEDVGSSMFRRFLISMPQFMEEHLSHKKALSLVNTFYLFKTKKRSKCIVCDSDTRDLCFNFCPGWNAGTIGYIFTSIIYHLHLKSITGYIQKNIHICIRSLSSRNPSPFPLPIIPMSTRRTFRIGSWTEDARIGAMAVHWCSLSLKWFSQVEQGWHVPLYIIYSYIYTYHIRCIF